MKLKVLMFLMTLLVFIGCGSTGASGSITDTDKKDDNNTPIVKLPDTNKTDEINKTMLNANYMLNGKGIEGIAYSCEDNTIGTTSKDGNFSYAKDLSKVCTFKINDIPLTMVDTTKIVAGEIVDPGYSKETKRVLLSLDDDANASNGIKVLPEVITALNGKLKSRQDIDTDAGVAKMVGYLSGVTDYHGKAFVSSTMVAKIIGYKSDKKYIYGEDVTVEANVTGVEVSDVTYTWKIGSSTYTTSKVVLKNLAIGSHDINLTVKDKQDNIVNDSVKIEVSDYLVKIKPTKTEYKKDENVTLEANVTGTVATLGYTWSDKHTKWKDDKFEGPVVVADNLSSITTPKLTHKFSIGHHKVTLKVSANSVDREATFDFDVIDYTDFNRTLSADKRDRVIIHKNLMWVDQPKDLNATDGKPKCAKIHKVSETNLTLRANEFEAGKTFCSDMVFFGKDDWRTPTPAELKTFIDDSLKQNFLSVYDDKCARLLAITNTSHPEANASYATVMTRYSSSPAIDSNLTPNIGIRCVRP